jgi:hypothetical protein
MLASEPLEEPLGTTDTTQRAFRGESWSRRRGIVTAVVAILVVALTLVLSRLDLANELTVVRSELTAANQELEESEAELDELQEQARVQAEAIAACRDSAELGEEARAALQTIQRGVDRGDQRAVAQGVSDVLRIDSEWSQANATCAEAAAESG